MVEHSMTENTLTEKMDGSLLKMLKRVWNHHEIR